MQVVSDDNGYHIYNRALSDDNEETDEVVSSRDGYGYGEMEYCDVHVDSRPIIASLKPGESVTVHVAAVIHADEADKLFIIPSLYDSGLEGFKKETLDIGYVDARVK